MIPVLLTMTSLGFWTTSFWHLDVQTGINLPGAIRVPVCCEKANIENCVTEHPWEPPSEFIGPARGNSSGGDERGIGSGGVGSFLSVHWSGDNDMEDTRLWVQACVKNGHKGSMRLLSRLAIYHQLTII